MDSVGVAESLLMTHPRKHDMSQDSVGQFLQTTDVGQDTEEKWF